MDELPQELKEASDPNCANRPEKLSDDELEKVAGGEVSDYDNKWFYFD